MLILYATVTGAVSAAAVTVSRMWRVLRRIEQVSTQVLGNTDPASGPVLPPLWQLRNQVNDIAGIVHAELSPNGGSSVKDTVARLDRHQQTIRRDLGQVRRALDRHLADHESR